MPFNSVSPQRAVKKRAGKRRSYGGRGRSRDVEGNVRGERVSTPRRGQYAVVLLPPAARVKPEMPAPPTRTTYSPRCQLYENQLRFIFKNFPKRFPYSQNSWYNYSERKHRLIRMEVPWENTPPPLFVATSLLIPDIRQLNVPQFMPSLR